MTTAGAPRSSIIIRAFNEESHIERCVEGVRAQRDAGAFEVILVDSGSTDATVAIAERFGVTVVRIEPEAFSFGYSLNMGIAQARGDFCVMLSAHCYPTNDQWLANLTRPFADASVALVYGKQRGDAVTKYSEHQLFARWFPEESVARQTLPFCNNANAAVRRRLWESWHFDEKLTGMEDIAWATQALSRGHLLSYAGDAGVIHVHDESWRQVYVRYEREALALRAIYPGHAFSLLDFLKLFALNTVGDARHALRDGVFLRNAAGIVAFRLLQFWATYVAHREPEQLTAQLRRRLYYPRGRTRRDVDAPTGHQLPAGPPRRSAARAPRFIDISRPLHSALPVWPGSARFDLRWIKSVSEHGVNESQLAFNSHTGTHVDAPYHFLADGKRVHHLDLDAMVGEAYVLDYPGDEPVDVGFLQQSRLPDGCRRVLLRTRNSQLARHGHEFVESFVAITPASARWLVERGVRLIGTDGNSIQQFCERTNETHKILLGADVVILEGLDLTDAAQGWYRLIALPLNVQDAEGAPARAVLVEQQ